ncbi:unnamed protein product [Heterobilharzia americana]|nr:unnamed protein product [Heterobilharzia americana]
MKSNLSECPLLQDIPQLHNTDNIASNHDSMNLLPSVYRKSPRMASNSPYLEENVNKDVMHTNIDPSRYRGLRDLDFNSWDDEAAAKLRFSLHPSGDLFDYLSLCRHSFGLRPLTRSVNTRPIKRTFGRYSLSFIRYTGSCFSLQSFSTDPGSIPIGAANQALAKYLQQYSSYLPTTPVRCTKCLSIKPMRAHHCRICQRCIRKMDHHCPWVNNCVGEGNQKYFILFAFYICLMSFSAIAMCIYFIFQCLSSDWEICQSNQSLSLLGNFSPLACSAFALGLICESLMFGIFTLVMCITQLCAISNDETQGETQIRNHFVKNMTRLVDLPTEQLLLIKVTTTGVPIRWSGQLPTKVTQSYCSGIESFKKEQTSWEKHSRRRNFIKTFGPPFSWKWLSPFSPPPPLAAVIPGLPDNFDLTIMLYLAEKNATRQDSIDFQTDFNQVGYIV